MGNWVPKDLPSTICPSCKDSEMEILEQSLLQCQTFHTLDPSSKLRRRTLRVNPSKTSKLKTMTPITFFNTLLKERKWLIDRMIDPTIIAYN